MVGGHKEEDSAPVVESVRDFLSIIEHITKGLSGYVFRGQSNFSKYKLESGAKRRIRKSCGTGSVAKWSTLELYHQFLINSAKSKGHYFGNGTRELSIFEILAELQHFGAATLLIDFTRNALVALYFSAIDESTDGSVHVARISDTFRFREIPLSIVTEKDFKKAFYSIIYNRSPYDLREEYVLEYWEPSILNQRIPAQDSIFILDTPNFPENYFEKIRIAKEAKQDIREKLERFFNISPVSLFNDLPGFARFNSAESQYTLSTDNRLGDITISIQRGNIDEALSDLNKLIEENNVPGNAFLLKGQILESKNKLEEAVSNYSRAYELDSSHVEFLIHRGIAKRKSGKIDEAINDYDIAEKLNPETASIYYNRGVAKRKRGNNYEAIEDYNKALELDPNYVLALKNRGVAKRKSGDFEGAIADFNKALELDPNNISALKNRGVAKRKSGDFEGAIADFNEILKLDPSNQRAKDNRGLAYLYKGDLVNSELDIEEVTKNNPKNSKYLRSLTELLIKKGEYCKALKFVEDSLRLNKNNPFGYLFRGIAYALLGKKIEEGGLLLDVSDFSIKAKNDFRRARKLAVVRKDMDVFTELEKWEETTGLDRL